MRCVKILPRKTLKRNLRLSSKWTARQSSAWPGRTCRRAVGQVVHTHVPLSHQARSSDRLPVEKSVSKRAGARERDQLVTVWRRYRQINPLTSLTRRSGFLLKPYYEFPAIISSLNIFHLLITQLLKKNLAISSRTLFLFNFNE